MSVSFALLLLVGQGAGSEATGPFPIEAVLRGIVIGAPESDSAEVPCLKLADDARAKRAGPCVRLILPGDDHVRKAVTAIVGQAVLVIGPLQILPNDLQKGGARKTEHVVRVQQMTLQNGGYVIGPSSLDGRWIAVSYRNGLRLYDTMQGKGHEVYAPFDAPQGSQIEWATSATFSPRGNHVLTRRGLESTVWTLLEMRPVPFREKALTPKATFETVDLFESFSPDGQYVEMREYSGKAEVSAVILFRVETGEEVARLPIANGYPRTSFLPDGLTMAVVDGKLLTLLSLATGRQLASVKVESGPVGDAYRAPATKLPRQPSRRELP